MSIVQHSHSSPTPTVEETRNSSFHSLAFFEATGRLSSVQHVLHFCFGNTTTLFTTENAGRFYFQRRFRGAQGSQRFRRAQRIHAAALTVYSCLNVLGRFTVCWGEIQTWGDSHFKLKKLEFSTRTCCQISGLASPVYTLGFNCASLCSVLCKCVVTHHGEYCEPATSTHLILNP